MNGILEAFADDNLRTNPIARKESSKCRKAARSMYETAEELEKKLNNEERKLFERFCNAQGEESHMYQVDRFIQGYRLGVLMMFEVFTGTSDFILSGEGQ